MPRCTGRGQRRTVVAFIKKQGLRALFGALLFGAGAAAARAQSASFDLPFEAHWGKVTLQPGHYKITAPEPTTWPQILYLMGPNKLYTVMASLLCPVGFFVFCFLFVLFFCVV